ncbi:MAG: D-alanyl-D-alanine carboxypeptidase, partial [Muribaculaceae bacterium]|nr:D-alanyl-D-alanine carboxypeptidase [Muribaculaceae bacterium]
MCPGHRRGSLRAMLTLTAIVWTLILQAMSPQEAVNKFVDTPRLPKGSMAVLVTELPSGKALASYNTDMPLTPASIMKSVTIASASDVMKIDHEMVTPVYIDGKVDHDGVLAGNLII